MNRVEREARLIAESFDRICGEATSHLEAMYSRCAMVAYTMLKADVATVPELHRTCAVVLSNALKSLTAAFSLLRAGWRLQPYVCIRNGMEAASVAIHLYGHQDELEKFKDGRLNAPGTLKTAKTAIPLIGRLYGILSEEFVHVGKPFAHIQQGSVYLESEWQMWQCLAAISFFGFTLYVTSDLIFYDFVSAHNCWRRRDDNRYETQWSDEIASWRSEFVRIYSRHYKGPMMGAVDT